MTAKRKNLTEGTIPAPPIFANVGQAQTWERFALAAMAADLRADITERGRVSAGIPSHEEGRERVATLAADMADRMLAETMKRGAV